MMTREQILSLLKTNNHKELIRVYLKEKEKKEEEIEMFLVYLQTIPELTIHSGEVINACIEYYLKKFSIIIVKTKENQIIDFL